ncbi:MAG: AAA family ATPase [Hyphomonadaceae bacterium]
MHIAELRLSGFKSFVDHVRAPIEPGLTGVVGPNGCGKSNLLEAVRWAMGANSAKSMRADDMDSVIFSGSAARPAREHAEVTLVLKDALGRAPGTLANDDTLEVSRRIRRGLGSTYRINGKEVRAKDVQLLFADASTGANSPALVRQGQVSELIAAKPENRRRILEEAAGIAGLHARRHEADLKLNAAEANLQRLDEILAEIAAQAASLKKQARQAERYRGLAAAIREAEALLLHRRWLEARSALAELEAQSRAAERETADAALAASQAQAAAEAARETLPPLREEEMVASAVLRRLEGVRVSHERDLSDAEEKLARIDADRARTENERAHLSELKSDSESALVRLEAERSALSADDALEAALAQAEARAKAAEAARADAEARLEALSAEAAARLARARALAETAETARARLERLGQRLANLRTTLESTRPSEALRLKIAEAKAAAESAQAESSKARDALAKAENALKQAEAADDAAWPPARGAQNAVQELAAEIRALEQLSPPPAGKAFAPVLNEISVDEGYERALAAALGEDIDASRNKEAPLRWAGADVRPMEWPIGVRPLSEHVTAPGELAARLARVGVVESGDGAILAAHIAPGARLVSLHGDLWRWDGFHRRADAPQPAAARLEQRNRLKAARKELAEAKDRAERLQAHALETQKVRRAAEDVARAIRQTAPQLAAKAAETARAEERLASEAALADARAAALGAQIEQMNAEHAEAESGAAEAAAASAGAPVGGETDLAVHRAEVERLRRDAAEARAAHAGLARERAAHVARREQIERDIEQWRARAQSATQRLDALDGDEARLTALREAALAVPEAARTALQALREEQTQAEARRTAAADHASAGEKRVREADQAARDMENAHAAARERRAACEARMTGARERLADIETQAREATQHAPEELAGLAGSLLTSALGAGPIADVEKRLERLRTERDQAGPVNLRAEEEVAEAEKRIAELSREQQDVAQAVAKLRRGINALNAEGRARLLEAFETVNANFSTLFTTLFEGGQAKLTLTESEDPLAAGLEIMAQPPGKRLTTLSLMSGGEQALTATALIFAVFLANPAPLCVLDEVDAPLDDANVERYCRMLDEMKRLTATRFLIITHNPVTMARVDRLYGVTMPELGLSQLVSVDLGRARQLAATA